MRNIAGLAIIAFIFINSCSFSDTHLKIGIGDRFDQVIDGKNVIVYEEARKDGLRFKYFAIWLTPGWSAWVDKEMLIKLSRDGYTPVLIYYTFGDAISREYLERSDRKKLKEWYKDIKENLTPLLDINAETLVVLEPEFNNIPSSGETAVTEWEEWNEITGKAIDIIHKGAPYSKVGLCPGDWGTYNLSKCMNRVAQKSDFIAFQEMRAASDPSVDASTSEYKDVAGSAIKFSSYLKKTFNKPILWAYLAVSSYKNGNLLGWENEQAEIIKNIINRENELFEKGVFGFLYFAYYDDLSHGTEFFGEAEKYFGLKSPSGKPKKAFFELKKHNASE